MWVHIDKLSSPHAYIRIERPPGLVDPSPVPPLGKGSKAACPAEGKAWTYDTLPEELRKDAAQLVKHGSIAVSGFRARLEQRSCRREEMYL